MVLPGAGVDVEEVSRVARCFQGRILFMAISYSGRKGGVGRDLAVEALLGVEEGENGRPVPRLALFEWREDRCRHIAPRSP